MQGRGCPLSARAMIDSPSVTNSASDWLFFLGTVVPCTIRHKMEPESWFFSTGHFTTLLWQKVFFVCFFKIANSTFKVWLFEILISEITVNIRCSSVVYDLSGSSRQCLLCGDLCRPPQEWCQCWVWESGWPLCSSYLLSLCYFCDGTEPHQPWKTPNRWYSTEFIP